MAALFAMLTACAASPDRPDAAPDPVVIERTRTEQVCPAELALPQGQRPPVPDGAELSGNAAGMAWLQALLQHLGLIEGRLTDAAAQCPQQGASK